MQRLFFLGLCFGFIGLCFSPLAGANPHKPVPNRGVIDRIVAVVNDQIITLAELQQRTQLAARAMGISQITPDQVQALQRRTLLEMVDEQLQQQFALSQGLAITATELQAAKDRAISSMGQTNWENLTAGLAKAGEAKILAEATWARLETESIIPRVQLAGPEVDRMIAEMSKTQSRTEKNLSMIFIPREANGVSGTEPTQLMAQIYAQATAPDATSATFATLAQTYSAAKSAKQGGELGWLLSGEIPTSIAAAIEDLPAGAISQVVPTTEGDILVRVNGIRSQQHTVDFSPREEYLLALLATERPSTTTEVKATVNALQNTTKAAPKWPQVQAILTTSSTLEQYPRSSVLGWVPQAALQPAVREAVTRTKPGNWSGLVDDRGQLSRLYVAEVRHVMAPEVIALRERVQQSLKASRIELEGRRFMRELRQRAFVDIRL